MVRLQLAGSSQVAARSAGIRRALTGSTTPLLCPSLTRHAIGLLVDRRRDLDGGHIPPSVSPIRTVRWSLDEREVTAKDDGVGLAPGDRARGSRGALAAGEQPGEAGELGGQLHLVFRAVEGRGQVGGAERQAGQGDVVVDLQRLGRIGGRDAARRRRRGEAEGDRAHRASRQGPVTGVAQVRIRINRDAVTFKKSSCPGAAILDAAAGFGL